MRFQHFSVPLVATGALAQGATNSTPPFPDSPSIAEVASSSDSLSTLLSVVQEDRFSDLLQRLTGGIYTLLAPTNDAFAAFLETENGQRFQTDDQYAANLLSYHVILGVFGSQAFSGEGLVASEWVRTWYYEPSASPDVDARVGGYTDSDGNVQIVSGYLDTAIVQQANVMFTGGYVHVIDSVLTLPPTIPELLSTANFTSLLGAVSLAADAGLTANTLQALNQPTIFCPTNEAFQNIGSILGGLTAVDVANVLMYHVVDSPAWASDLTDGQELTTLGGGSLTVNIREGTDGPMVFINGARVVLPDLTLVQGVAHGIDQVLNPNAVVDAPQGAMAGVVQYDGAQAANAPVLTDGAPSPTATIALPGATGSATNGSYGAQPSYMPEQQTGAASTMKMSGAVAFGAAFIAAAL